MTKDVWIIGPTGQLGQALTEVFGERALPLGRAELDLENPDRIAASLAARPAPKLILNAAAYTQVDRAESDRELCAVLNIDAPRALAAFARDAGADFVHYSTDFVYSGEGDSPWRESDAAAPLNHYGETKLAGERAVAEAHVRARILRTSWLYSHRRQNFPLAILKHARETQKVKVVTDQIGSPTYAPDLAAMTAHIADIPFDESTAGVYNAANLGHVSRYDFAREIVALATRHEMELVMVKFKPTESADVAAPARRPLNTRLDLTKVQTAFGVQIPPWQEGLRAAIKRIYARN